MALIIFWHIKKAAGGLENVGVSHQMKFHWLLIASCALWGLPRYSSIYIYVTCPHFTHTAPQTYSTEPFEMDTLCLNRLVTYFFHLFVSSLFVCGKSVFLLALAFPQNSCLSWAAAHGAVVHEQIDKLSSACIKTAHLRHEGRLLGVVRALSKRSLRLSSVVMEWLPTPEQTDWIPSDLSCTLYRLYCCKFLLFFSFLFYYFFIGCQS